MNRDNRSKREVEEIDTSLLFFVFGAGIWIKDRDCLQASFTPLLHTLGK